MDLVNQVKLVALVGLVELVKPVAPLNWFLVYEHNFRVKLVLIRVCILAPYRSFSNSFCYMSLMAPSNECWNFFSSS
jgi:hypothetical protein